MCPTKMTKNREICPTKLDLSDKNDKKPQDMSDKNSLCFVGVFLKKTQIIPMCIHQAHACTLLLSSNMQLETYVAQLSSVLYYVLNKNGCIIGISRFKSHSKRLEVIIVSCQTHLAFFCRTYLAADISGFAGHI